MKGNRRLFSVLTLFAVSVFIVAVSFSVFSLALMESTEAYQGLSVGGVEISNLAYDEAVLLLNGRLSEQASQKQAVISFNGVKERVSFSKLGVQFLGDQALSDAFKAGKQGGFLERLDTIRAIENKGMGFPVDVAVDESILLQAVQEISIKYKKAPVKATLQFNPDSIGLFSIKDAIPGSEVNIAKLIKDLKNMLIDGNDHLIKAEFVDVAAEGNPADLMVHTKLIGRYTTKLNNNENRTANIVLFCHAVNGAVIMPGETYSLNQASGERTAAKGYFMAPTIAGGKEIVDDYGGGVCQVSGTLYNALLKTDLKIVERSPHSWPSDYAPLGQDATISWPNRDFKFFNNHDGPVFLKVFIQSDELIAEVYGKPLEDGVTIDVSTEVLKIENPPKSVFIVDNTLQAGQKVASVTPRKGYTTKTYRIYIRDNEVFNKELVSSSRYRAMRGEFRIGYETDDEKDQDTTGEAPQSTVVPVTVE